MESLAGGWSGNISHLCYSEEFNSSHETVWCRPKDECSQQGMILPLFIEVTWPLWVRITLYLIGLLYSFVAVFIVADIFMCSIDSITSTTRQVTDLLRPHEADVDVQGDDIR